MLTLVQLKNMLPHEIFMDGIATIPHPYEADKTVEVKWIAIRGGIHDWAIYHSFHSNITDMWKFGDDHKMAPESTIADHGAKIHDRDTVQRLVPCKPEALKMYRD